MTSSTEPDIYRDQHWLVVPIENAVFPNRCVKTNKPAEIDYLFEIDLMRGAVMAPDSEGEFVTKALFGSVGAAAVELANRRPLKYQIGLSDDRQLSAYRRKRVGIFLLLAIPLFLIGFVIIGQAILDGAKPPLPLMIGVAVVAAGLFVAGIALFALASMGVLRVARSDGKHVWFEGAGHEFLATLPDSPIKFERGAFVNKDESLESVRTCPQCGRELSQHSKICPRCDYRFT